MNRKGTIIQMQKERVFVMTEDSLFVSIERRPEMFLGQQIEVTGERRSHQRRKSIPRYASIAASMAAVFILMVFAYFSFLHEENHKIYAYVSVDINPSIELGIDKEEKVVEVTCINDDSRRILEGIELEGIPLDEALDRIIKMSKKNGFIHPLSGNTVLLSLTFSDKEQKPQDKDLEEMIVLVRKFFEGLEGMPLEAKLIKASLDEREQAMQNHMSTARYVVFTKAQEEGVKISVEEAKEANITKILKEVPIECIELNHPVQGEEIDGNNQTREPKGQATVAPAQNIPEDTVTPEASLTPVTPDTLTSTPELSGKVDPTVTQKTQIRPTVTPKPTTSITMKSTPRVTPRLIPNSTPRLIPKITATPTAIPTPNPLGTATPLSTLKPAITPSAPAVATPQRQNVAWGKQVLASSHMQGGYVGNAVDGNMNSHWSAKADRNQWIQVNLGKVYIANSINIYWGEKDYAKKYEVLISDGSYWYRVAVVNGNGGLDTITFPYPVYNAAVYIGCLQGGDHPEAKYSIHEIQVF